MNPLDEAPQGDEPVTIEQLLAETAAELGILPGEDTDEADSIDDPEQLEAEAAGLAEASAPDAPAFDVFDALLNESMYAYQANIKARKGQRLTGREREVLHYEDVERNWERLGIVAQIENRVCSGCGSSHPILVGWYIILQHRNDPTAKRLCRIDQWDAEAKANLLSLPIRRNTTTLGVEVCGLCVPVDQPASSEEVLAWGLATLEPKQ